MRANAAAPTVVQSRRELGRLRRAGAPRPQDEHDTEFGQQRDRRTTSSERGSPGLEDEAAARAKVRRSKMELRSPKTIMKRRICAISQRCGC